MWIAVSGLLEFHAGVFTPNAETPGYLLSGGALRC